MNVLSYTFILHWISDFVTQIRWIADNKSSNVWILLLHVVVYVFCMFFGLAITIPLGLASYSMNSIIMYAIVNFVLHFLVDYNTSKMTAYYWKHGRVKSFFTMIGFDQLVHNLCLIATYEIFLK